MTNDSQKELAQLKSDVLRLQKLVSSLANQLTLTQRELRSVKNRGLATDSEVSRLSHKINT